MKFTELRTWLSHLQNTDRIAVIKKGCDLQHRLPAIAKILDGEQATYFQNPKGFDMPVISGFMSKRSWIAEAMGVSEEELLPTFRRAAENPIPWHDIGDGSAPCQEVQIKNPDLYKLLPIPTHSEHDYGPYITAGLVIARNPSTGKQNVSINRIQLHATGRLGILMLPRHLFAFFKLAEKNNQPLDVAIVIGIDPLTLLASQAIAPLDHDELEIAGALHGKALDVVKCKNSEIRVPVNAEIVIEGKILANERELEGPFGEFPKYYSARENREVIQVDLLTHRKDAIYHTIIPAEMEHLLLGAIPRESTLLSHLQRSFQGVLDVHLSVGGVARYHLYVKLKKSHEGQPKNVIMAAFGAHYDVKQVIVVDEDVDVHQPQQVEWAVATRFQAHRDLIVIEGAQGSILDPSTTVEWMKEGGELVPPHQQGLSSKMGLDATRPMNYQEHVFTRVRIPGEDTIDVRQELDSKVKVNFI
jgi:2,5-furandicarboxylate decarboxylase 1